MTKLILVVSLAGTGLLYGFELPDMALAVSVAGAILALAGPSGVKPAPPPTPEELARREVALEEARREAEERRRRQEAAQRQKEEVLRAQAAAAALREEAIRRQREARRAEEQREERARKHARLTERATEMITEAVDGETVSKRRISRLRNDLRDSGMAPIAVPEAPRPSPEFALDLAREGLLTLPDWEEEQDVRTVITGGLDG